MNDRNVTQGACPIKVLEYTASGRPLVAANMPIVRELAREDVDGLLFSPNDPDDLSKFTWHAAQKKLVKVYNRLLTD